METIPVKRGEVPEAIANNGPRSAHAYREKLNMVGQVFGRLTIRRMEARLNGKTINYFAHCKCECGNKTTVNVKSLKTGLTKSCGCLQKENKGRPQTNGIWAEGNDALRLQYDRFKKFNARCCDSNNKHYKDYGGRGITVERRWNILKVGIEKAFANFHKDMGFPPKGKSLDRKENDGPYSKDNCKWSTKAEQTANRRSSHKGVERNYIQRNAITYTYQGKLYPRMELCHQLAAEWGLRWRQVYTLVRSKAFKIEKVDEIMQLALKAEQDKAEWQASRSDREIIYSTLWNARDRCTNPNSSGWKSHGAKGIRICTRWDLKKVGTSTAILNFIEDLGYRPTPQHSLDRIIGTKGYRPSNCRWATKEEQASNRHTNKLYSYGGGKLTRQQLAAVLAAEYKRPVKTIVAKLANNPKMGARQVVAWISGGSVVG